MPAHFAGLAIDEYVVMPNHMHGILVIDGVTGAGTTACRFPTREAFGRPVHGSVATIVRSFKAAVSKRVNELRSAQGAPLWQRNYYEHVVRKDDDLRQIREYIAQNPANWANDDLYTPNRTP